MILHHLFGAAHLDRIGSIDGQVQAAQSNPGRMRETPGGAALNVASSLAALGAQVSLSSIVANDAAGAKIREAASERGISWTDLPGDASLPTATYTAILDQHCDLLIALADMEIYASASVGDVTIEPSEWLLVDANLPPTAIGALSKIPCAHRTAMTVSAAKASRLRSFLSTFDLLITNRAEAAALCDAPKDSALPDIAAALSQRGCRRAVITDGPNPLCLLEEGAHTAHSIPETEIADVTGAGDALAAGLLFALGNGAPFQDAVASGIHAAQAILAVRGPYRSDIATASGVLS